MTVPPVREEQSRVDAELFRQLLRRHAAGVVVVTAPGDPPAGFTASSFTSVSLEPPLVSFTVGHAASAWPTFEAAEVVAVHVLAEGQEPVARTFAATGVDRLAEHRGWRAGPGGVPLLDGVLVCLVCRVYRLVPAGDHTIVLATPIAGEQHPDPVLGPLVYHSGRYAVLPPRG